MAAGADAVDIDGARPRERTGEQKLARAHPAGRHPCSRSSCSSPSSVRCSCIYTCVEMSRKGTRADRGSAPSRHEKLRDLSETVEKVYVFPNPSSRPEIIDISLPLDTKLAAWPGDTEFNYELTWKKSQPVRR